MCNARRAFLFVVVCWFTSLLPAAEAVQFTVMVVGRNGNDSSSPWKIYDPDGGVVADLGKYGNAYSGTRRYRGPQTTYRFPLEGMTVRLYSPAEPLVIAPDGRKTGVDPASGRRYSEIPYSTYQLEGYDNAVTGEVTENKTKIVEILGRPPEGQYTVQITGTGSGLYSFDVETHDSNWQILASGEITDVPIQVHEVHKYTMQYSATATQPLDLKRVPTDTPPRDSVAPTVTVVLSPNEIWPPNRKMVSVAASVSAQDDQDPHPSVILASITCNECANPAEDVADAEYGTDDFTFSVRADRTGQNREGRVYTVTYSATDAAGNIGYGFATIIIPHDQRR